MSSPKTKAKKKPPKDNMTLLPCFYFVEIMLGEGLMYCYQSRVKQRKAAGSINAGGSNFNSFLRRTVRFVGVHVFGLLATALVTDIIQLATGYPTPFFLTVCQPNYTLPGISCDQNNYITQDICSGKDLYAILSARKTFPSQHATLSGFAAVYISMYFNSVISNSTKLMKPLLVFSYCLAAGVAGLTQLTQHRCHPRDVYAGYAIGAGIGVYLVLYVVSNFRPSEEDCPPQPVRRAASPPFQEREAMRTLCQRGQSSQQHGSLYRTKTPRNSTSREELGTGRCKVRREKASVASLKRASADVELLAPRGPMGKETMVTFSNTLPRVANGNSSTSPSGDAPSSQRHMTFHLPFDPSRPQQRLRPPLVQEWRQQSSTDRQSEGEGGTDRSGEGERAAGGGGGAGMNPPSLYPTVQAAGRAVAMATPAPAPLVHIPEEGNRHPLTISPLPPSVSPLPPPVSPKSAVTRAKLMSLNREGPIPVTTPRVPTQPPNQPRVAQVIAMSKQHGPIPSAKASDSASSCGGGSSTGSSESPYYRILSERDSHPGSVTGSVVTIDAHAPHHPVVRVSSGTNGTPWEWRNTISGSLGSTGDQGQRGALQRQEKITASEYREYREYRTLPVKSDSICSSSPSETDSIPLPPPPHPVSSPLPPLSPISSHLPPPPPPTSSAPLSPPPPVSYSPLPPPPHPDLLLDTHPLHRSMTLPRRPTVSAHSHAHQEVYYKTMQAERRL
ncbi:hypothetical protein UPYG_G00024080 [Umbra pygmaea]|uniref:Phospholipid phosphatase-related protein type 3 n=1 Tax=Umbra pygmaea TaxID=75934 RepID=A0ABD0XLI9_UMBPY